MIVMPSNATGTHMRALAAQYPGRVGNLISPGKGAWRNTILDTYALDNGAWGSHRGKRAWNEHDYVALLERARLHRAQPRWIAVPDVVKDWPATLVKWHEWSSLLRDLYRWPLALVVQDGAEVSDAAQLEADVIFIGGSKKWKYETLRDWTAAFPRVHVGRVNSYPTLMKCYEAGAESADGTGLNSTDWQRADVQRFLSETAG